MQAGALSVALALVGSVAFAAPSTVIVSEPTFGTPVTLDPQGAIACPTATSCTEVAVVSGAAVARVESAGVWGTEQTILPASAGEIYDAVSGVACPSLGNCTALVVTKTQTTLDTTHALTETGGTWAAPQQLTPPSSVDAPYEAGWTLSCPSAGACTAVGTFDVADTWFYTGVATSAAGTWGATTEMPEPGLKQPEVYPIALSCSDATDCTELVGAFWVGSHGDPSEYSQVEVGGTWSAPAPITADPDWSFEGLDCWAPGSCIAVGAEAPPGTVGISASYIFMQNDIWQPPHAVPPAILSPRTDFGDLVSASCSSPSTCVAVGSFSPFIGNTYIPVAISIDGGVASAVALERATGSLPEPVFSDVTCPAVSTCFAVMRSEQSAHESLVAVSPSSTFTSPGPPIGLAVQPRGTGARLAWAAPLADGGAPVTGYVASILDTSRGCHTSTDRCTIVGLPAGHRWRAEVYDVTAEGRSPIATVTFVLAKHR